jgi:hypothetical protein
MNKFFVVLGLVFLFSPFLLAYPLKVSSIKAGWQGDSGELSGDKELPSVHPIEMSADSVLSIDELNLTNGGLVSVPPEKIAVDVFVFDDPKIVDALVPKASTSQVSVRTQESVRTLLKGLFPVFSREFSTKKFVKDGIGKGSSIILGTDESNGKLPLLPIKISKVSQVFQVKHEPKPDYRFVLVLSYVIEQGSNANQERLRSLVSGSALSFKYKVTPSKASGVEIQPDTNSHWKIGDFVKVNRGLKLTLDSIRMVLVDKLSNWLDSTGLGADAVDVVYYDFVADDASCKVVENLGKTRRTLVSAARVNGALVSDLLWSYNNESDKSTQLIYLSPRLPPVFDKVWGFQITKFKEARRKPAEIVLEDTPLEFVHLDIGDSIKASKNGKAVALTLNDFTDKSAKFEAVVDGKAYSAQELWTSTLETGNEVDLFGVKLSLTGFEEGENAGGKTSLKSGPYVGCQILPVINWVKSLVATKPKTVAYIGDVNDLGEPVSPAQQAQAQLCVLPDYLQTYNSNSNTCSFTCVNYPDTHYKQSESAGCKTICGVDCVANQKCYRTNPGRTTANKITLGGKQVNTIAFDVEGSKQGSCFACSSESDDNTRVSDFDSNQKQNRDCGTAKYCKVTSGTATYKFDSSKNQFVEAGRSGSCEDINCISSDQCKKFEKSDLLACIATVNGKSVDVTNMIDSSGNPIVGKCLPKRMLTPLASVTPKPQESKSKDDPLSGFIRFLCRSWKFLTDMTHINDCD